MINKELLSLLVCPLDKAALTLDGDRLVCTGCGLKYSIKDDIPNMLIEEAELPEGCKALADLACVRSGAVKLD